MRCFSFISSTQTTQVDVILLLHLPFLLLLFSFSLPDHNFKGGWLRPLCVHSVIGSTSVIILLSADGPLYKPPIIGLIIDRFDIYVVQFFLAVK